MADFEVKMTGLNELQGRMRALPKNIDRRLLNVALRYAARSIQKAAREGVDRIRPMKGGKSQHTGHLKASIFARAVRPRDGHTAVVTIGVRGAKQVTKTNSKGKSRTVWVRAKDYPFYWIYHEFGTSKMGKTPFMRPAFESNKLTALNDFKEKMPEVIDKAVAKTTGGRV